MQNFRTLGAALTLAALAACGGGAPAPATVPTPTDAPAPDRAGAVTGATRFSWTAGERHLEVRTDALVTRDAPAVPTAAPAAAPAVTSTAAADAGSERVLTTAYLSAQLAAASSGVPGAVEVLGTVDSLVVSASGRVRGDSTAPVASNTLIAGFRYRAASDARGVRVEAADPGTDLRCTASAGAASLAALAAVRETIPRIPPDLAAGARWRDTSVTASCAGPVLLVAQTVARYESTADPAAPGRLRITRQSTTTARGQGTSGVRPLAVAVSGTARTVYALDPARGQLVDGSGEGRTTVTLTVAGVAQRFTQQTRTQLVVR